MRFVYQYAQAISTNWNGSRTQLSVVFGSSPTYGKPFIYRNVEIGREDQYERQSKSEPKPKTIHSRIQHRSQRGAGSTPEENSDITSLGSSHSGNGVPPVAAAPDASTTSCTSCS